MQSSPSLIRSTNETKLKRADSSIVPNSVWAKSKA